MRGQSDCLISAADAAYCYRLEDSAVDVCMTAWCRKYWALQHEIIVVAPVAGFLKTNCMLRHAFAGCAVRSAGKRVIVKRLNVL